MDGYKYLLQRNRLMMNLEEELEKIKTLPDDERRREKTRLEAEFDRALGELYSQVADEYPGERKGKARPTEDSR